MNLQMLIISFLMLPAMSIAQEHTSAPPKLKITESQYSPQRNGHLEREEALKNPSTIQLFDENGKFIEMQTIYDGELYNRTVQSRLDSCRISKSEDFDSEGTLTRYWVPKYDEACQLVEIKFYDANDQLTTLQTSTFDANGNELSNIQEDYSRNQTHTRSYTYNSKNQMTEFIYYNDKRDEKGVRTYEYDDEGNESKQTYVDPKGEQTVFISEYDENNNLITHTWYDEAGVITNLTSFTYSYDEYGKWITKKRSTDGELTYVWERIIKYAGT